MSYYIVDKLSNSFLAGTNCIYLKSCETNYVTLTSGGKVSIFKVIIDNSIKEDRICLNLFQRQLLDVQIGEKIIKEDININYETQQLKNITFIVKNIKTNCKIIYELTEDNITNIKNSLNGIPVHNELYLSIEKNNLCILPINLPNLENNKIITSYTMIKFIAFDKNITIDNLDVSTTSTQLFNGNFNFIDMGIGGLDNQFEIMFRRTFSSRLLPDKMLKNLGINHVRGIILYGAPGCGKTLIARQIGKILNCENPKVVNGPSLMSSYIGKSEENVRNLFADAIADKSSKKLHLIILDEFDALAKKRGAPGPDASVMDKIVNQFLTMIDGPESLNNILLIAMTNRLDMIDEALLRPGRFEVQIEITLPDEKGRKDILTIHTNKMKTSGYLNDNVDLNELAKLTKNFTGAEIESVVKNAVSYSIAKELDPNNLTNAKDIKPVISQTEFIKSINEIKPQFGTVSKDIEIITSIPFELYSNEYEKIYEESISYINSLKQGNLLSILIEGEAYTGKTTLACQIAKKSGFNCIKFINSELLLNNTNKEQMINDIIINGTRSDTFLLILDSVEKLIEYSPLGTYYNNKVLQIIYTILGKIIEPTKKIVIILTSSNYKLISELGIRTLCSVVNFTCDVGYDGTDNKLVSKYFKDKKFYK